MGGINDGIGGNNKERDNNREDPRQDIKANEADAAGLSPEERGLGARPTAEMQDPSNPANFAAGPNSQDIKDEHDPAKPSTASGTDPLAQQKQYNDGMSGAGGRDGNSMYAKMREDREELLILQEERRAQYRALTLTLGAIADIQTYDQFKEYHAAMGAQLATLEQDANVVEEELNEVKSEYDQRIQAMEDALDADKARLATLDPSSPEHLKLKEHINATETVLTSFKNEHAQLTSEWDNYTSDYKDAKTAYDAIQAKMDAAEQNGVSPEELEALKQQLQDAENKMNTARESLGEVEDRITFANDSLDIMESMTVVMTEHNAEEHFTPAQLAAQTELSNFFTNARADGKLTAEEMQRMGELNKAAGLDPENLQKIQDVELRNALIDAQQKTIAGIQNAGLAIQTTPDGEFVTGESAKAIFQPYTTRLSDVTNATNETTAQAAAVVVGLDKNATALAQTGQALEQNQDPRANNTAPLIQASYGLLAFTNAEKQGLTDQSAALTEEIQDTQNKLEALQASGTASAEDLQAIQEQIAKLETDHAGVQERIKNTAQQAELVAELQNEIKLSQIQSENSCVIPGVFEATGAKANALLSANAQGLTREQTQEAMAAAAAQAHTDNAIDFSQMTLPNGELIGQAGTAAIGTPELTPDPAAQEASIAIQALMDGGKVDYVVAAEKLRELGVDPEEYFAKRPDLKFVNKPDDPNSPQVSVNSAFVTPEPKQTQMASYASLGPAGPGAIQVPTQTIAGPTGSQTAYAPANYASFADSELDKYGPPLAGSDTPTNNRAPDTGTAAKGFGAAQQPAATGSGTLQNQMPGTPVYAKDGSGAPNTTDVATATAAREAELRQAELIAQQQNNPNSNTPGGAGGSSIT